MDSFENYIEQNKKRLITSFDYPLTDKRNIQIYSARNNNLNKTSSSSIYKHKILIQNKSNFNKNINYSYHGNLINDILDISKTNLEFDIQLTSLKKKLSVVKEQRKQSEMKVNLMKIKINKLLNEEKNSIKKLENTKRIIQKIKSNRQNRENIENKNKNYKKTFKMKNNYSKNNTLLNNKIFINMKNTSLNNSSYIDKINFVKYKSSQASMRKIIKTNKIQNNFGLMSFNKRNLINKKILNYSKFNTGNISNDSFGTYSLRNTSINLDKSNINNSKNNIFNNSCRNIDIYNSNKNNILNNSNMNNKIINKKNLKDHIKQNLLDKLRKHELERKKIQEKIKQIEKEQLDLCMNFNENINSGYTTSNTIANSNHKVMKVNELYYKDEDDNNIFNYNFI